MSGVFRMKSVLISIQPKWCELIASGKKTIEVRKTAPKLETPFKCYIYCTGNKDARYLVRKNGIIQNLSCFDVAENNLFPLNCKVIGEFVCDDIETLRYRCDGYGDEWHEWNDEFVDYKDMCLSEKELEDYLGTSNGYGWHISDLKIYNKPKELGEFKRCAHPKEKCFEKCEYWGYSGCCNRLTNPPQSWFYIEE